MMWRKGEYLSVGKGADMCLERIISWCKQAKYWKLLLPYTG
jgi:hypothetical protein